MYERYVALLWSAKIGEREGYKHLAPLERNHVSLRTSFYCTSNFNSPLTDFFEETPR